MLLALYDLVGEQSCHDGPLDTVLASVLASILYQSHVLGNGVAIRENTLGNDFPMTPRFTSSKDL